MTNDDAIAFAMLGMKLGAYSRKEAKRLYADMRELMDEMTEEEARERAAEWLFGDE